ncbi:HalOD1 output domain-containing protein [Natronococcus wangiae]|uniref:HalOD1 output domain-containing protein n=1 Tax=Natronococcus wangiae TaxID=3068275 RepID=UPI00273D10EA|nr:HalOD1 output domain-containing protein [Natronococcus sp. AD5]
MSSPNDTSAPGGGGKPTQAIIEAIARHEGVDVTEVEPPAYEPLYTVVNPEALDSLFRTASDAATADAHVSLEYAGYDITVHSDGRVDVTDPSTGEIVPDHVDE